MQCRRRTQRRELPSTTSCSTDLTSSVAPPEVSDLQRWLNQQQHQQRHNILDPQTCLALLHTCGRWKLLSEGRCVHAVMRNHSHLSAHTPLANRLVNMYGQCRSLEDAAAAFREIASKDVVSWTSMIGIYARSGHSKEALALLGQMLQQSGTSGTCAPNDVTFITILNACGGNASECHIVYSLVAMHRYESDVPVANAAVTAYARCGSTSDAHSVFEHMKDRNVVSWTTMIKAFAVGDLNREKSYETLNRMHIEGVTSNTVTYITLLHACAASQALSEGMRIHVVVAEMDGFSDIVLGGALVDMYAKCRNIDYASKLFNALPHRNAVVWNSMIKLFRMHEHDHPNRKESFRYFAKMHLEGVSPDTISFIIILGTCASSADLGDGRILHAWCVEMGLEFEVELGCGLIDMYGKCRSIADAQVIHDNRFQKQKYNVLSWSCLIAAYINVDQIYKAVELFYQMQLEGFQPNKVTFSSLLSGFGSDDSDYNLMLGEAHGKIIHVWANEFQISSDDIMGSSLISMYGKYGNMEDAQKVFDKVHDRSIITWNALIGAYGQNRHVERCLQLFGQLVLSHDHNLAETSNVSFSCVLSACADMRLLGHGKKIHGYTVECNMETDVMIGSALINLYGKHCRLEEAQWMFDNLHERTLIAWNNIISAHCLCGNAKQVKEILEKMRIEGVNPSEYTMVSVLEACSMLQSLKEGEIVHASIIQMGYEKFPVISNALINMYGTCGSFRAAQSTFGAMEERNLVSWNSMIGMYANNGMPISEIFQLFKKLLQELVDFDKITLLHGLCVCASISLLSESQILYSCAIDKGIPIDFELSNVLMSMYTNTGNVEDARNVFNHSMPNHDVISWTTMIVAYAQHTHAREAVELFQLMYQKQGIKPTQISFVDILSACSHSGLVDEGCEFFSSMMNEFSIIPTATHYSCLLDLLGRSGQLNKAESILATIPIQPERVLWITMFSACKIHEDFKRGNWIANHIMFQLVDHQDRDMTKSGEISSCIDADSLLRDEVVDDGKRKMGMSIEARLIMAPTLKDVEMDEVFVELKTLSTSSTNDADDSKDVSQISGECNYWFENNYHGDEIQQLVSMLR